MLKLSTAPREPFWLEILPGQRTQFRPVTMTMILAARQEAGGAVLEAAKTADQPRFAPSIAQATGNQAFTRTIAQLGIIAWDGVADAEGNAIAPDAERIDAYLANWRVFDAVDRLYVTPALVMADEKNASSPSRNGTSGARTRAKGSAGTAKNRARSALTS